MRDCYGRVQIRLRARFLLLGLYQYCQGCCECNVLTRSRGGPATGRCGTRASEQAGKALRSQGHQCAHVM